MHVSANLTSVTGLAVHKGQVWAGTPGGLVSWNATGQARHWTRKDGLPGIRIRTLAVINGDLWGLAEKPFRLTTAGFKVEPSFPAVGVGAMLSVNGLPGRAVGSTLVKGARVWAIPESGLWTIAGTKAIEFKPQPPTRRVTSLASDQEERTYVGTTDKGVLKFDGSKWSALPLPGQRLAGFDASALAACNEGLWIVPREGSAFTTEGKMSAAKGAPWRQSVKWRGLTVIRRADGRLASIDAAGTESPLGVVLPRVNATSIFILGETLFVSQPGGWSEFTPGSDPVHRFDVEPLKGCPTTSIWADQKQIAIGTQNNGLILISRDSGAFTHLHEAHGMTDDWVTAIAPDGQGGLLIGTFVGGLLRWDGEKITKIGLAGGCVNRLLVDGKSIWVGSLSGVYLYHEGKPTKPSWNRLIEPDVYDLAKIKGQLWVAAGGALHKISNPDFAD